MKTGLGESYNQLAGHVTEMKMDHGDGLRASDRLTERLDNNV